MDRRYELENLRRSLAMLRPEQMALTREQAMQLISELAEVRTRLDKLRAGLRALVDAES